MNVLDLFSGIGGFSVGLEATGMKTVAFCEPEPYCQKVLKKNWPEVPIYDDVRELTADRLVRDGISVDIITGGFPCQDISVAGKQAGIEGERSGLWSECARLLSELRPQYAIFENVTNLLTGDGGAWFQQVLWDISEVGYDAEWHCIPASAIGAPHRRDRVFIVAYPNSDDRRRGYSAEPPRRDSWMEPGSGGEGQSLQQASSDVAYSHSKRGRCGDSRRENAEDAWESPIITRKHARRVGAWDVEPGVGRVANGVPARAHRLKGLGNAIVPQIAQMIGEAIWDSSGS
jgi:DNA (cytosine-5)-methyltransferase 1